jgi:hypothetical protein
MLSHGEALLGRLAKPARRSRVVLRNTLAVVVHDPEIELSIGDALFGRLAIPTRRSGMVLPHALALVVHQPVACGVIAG